MIACYFALDNEFDCGAIINAIWKANKTCLLPIISRNRHEKIMRFAIYQPDDPLRTNQYHILEPMRDDTFSGDELDLVILPLVGFDEKGHRLGMGGGYYDATFAQTSSKPFLLGLGYECQKVPELPKDAWDILLNGVLTEQRLSIF